MHTIELIPFFHRGKENIALLAPNIAVINLAIKKMHAVKWSQSNKVWYLPLTKAAHEEILTALKPLGIIKQDKLIQYLHKRRVVAMTTPASAPQSNPAPLPGKAAAEATTAWALSAENLKALQNFVAQLQLKAYSTATIRTYRNELMQLLQLLKQRCINDLTTDDLRRYMLYLIRNGMSEHTAHSRLNALKFYFEQVLHREKFFWEIPRPKKPKELPRFFSQAEVASLINGVANTKHKTMLMLAYSAGLRVSEVVHIKTRCVDSARMSLLIERAKGKKDRMVGLSPVLLVMLRAYARDYKPDRKGYLFEGATKGQPYSIRSLQKVLEHAKQQAGIIKPGGMHSLRHSFATHLIDKGTDVTMIQKLLGHSDLKTTLRYLHTSNKDLLRIISPLDDLHLA